ncbi:hypothetical protein VZT92_024310 [Zoarces viviparus]|uniref:CBM21 domain-containing protein n=1 Tax=Zoarces viviparus TaxID=48416 RepID=A0AAW1E3J1_ZOAVI
MSSVTRLHLLSHVKWPSGACNLLGVPGLGPLEVDDDECEVVIGIRPKSSPRPRRRSSDSDEDSEPGPPMSASRRVSFADVKGLSLVHVKEFATWDVPKLPQCDSSVGKIKDAEVYFLSPLTFSLPLSTEELFVRVRDQKMELETIELLPGTTILKGVIRVLNISFNKAVYVRTTLDTWSSHFDLLAEYMPGTSDSLTDRFSFKLTLVPPFGEQGARVEFCLRYETSVGTFWANNNDRNYVLFCHRRMKERKETPQKERLNKKSCLKTVSQSFSTVENVFATEASSQENISTDVSKHGEIADTLKAEQISDGQSGTSEEDRQKLLTESRRNSSQRSCRKAARMVRVRDYFSQRDGGADETERDESPPEANQAAQEETPEQNHSDVQSLPEGSSKSGGSPFVSESLETCSEPLIDVPHDRSPSHDHTSDSETEKSESVNLADSATLTGDRTEVNWEMMVEEEEQNILTDEEESEAISLKTEKNKAEDADVSEGKQKVGEEIGEIMARKDREEVAKELEYVQDTNEAGEEDLAEEIEEEKREKQEEAELEKAKHFAEIHDVDTEKTNVENEEDIEGEEEIEIDLSDDDEAGVESEDQVKPREVNVEEENPDYEEDIFVVETGESEIIDAESESVTIEDGQNEAGCFEVRLDITQKLGDGLSAPVNNVQDKRAIDGENGHIPTEMHLYNEEDFQSKEAVTHDPTKAAGDENEAVAAEGGSFIFTDDPENDQTSHDSASAESDSDDEVELYMHCLRAVHTGAQAQTDRNKDAGFGEGKLRPSVSRGKLLPSPMPSISESQDEEQHPGRLLDTHEHVETALPASSGQESIDRSVSWWKETFSCSNISKTLLYATLLVVFLVVAYRYDFLACLGLYLISVVWLYCQGERQPKQQIQQQNRMN